MQNVQQQNNGLRNNNQGINARRQRANPNPAQNNNQGGQAQVPQVVQNQPRAHPKGFVEIQDGTIAALRCKYVLSGEANKALKEHFSYMLNSKDEEPRLKLGGQYGYDPHPHAVGAFMRAVSHVRVVEEVEFPDQPFQRLEVAPSEPREYGKYRRLKNGRAYPWIKHAWTMQPRLDARDDVRRAVNKTRIAKMCAEHNEREVAQGHANPFLLNPGMNQCTCTAMKVMPDPAPGAQPCECRRFFPRVVLTETAYYDGVLDFCYEKLITPDADGEITAQGYAIFNDYHNAYRANLDRVPEKNGAHGELELHALPGPDGKPESKHFIYPRKNPITKHWELMVRAEVRGNPSPYVHKVVNVGTQESFLKKYTDNNGVLWYIMYEQLDRFMNGEIPYVTYRMTATKPDRWYPEVLERMEIIDHLPFATIIPGLVTIPATNFLTVLPPKEDPPIELNLFDTAAYEKKAITNGDRSIDVKTHKERVRSHNTFIDGIRKRIWYNNKTHDLRIRVIDGEPWLYLSVLDRKWFGIQVCPNADGTARAKLSDVIEAYIHVGAKKTSSSVIFATVQAQKDMKRSAEIFDVVDSYYIALFIRSKETERLEAIVG